MQMMVTQGIEHGITSDGCGQWPGVVERIQADIVPHMGWNTVSAPDGSRMFAAIESERFYFVHSYAVQSWLFDVQPPFPEPIATWAEHGVPFLASIENGPLSATQFHPEKSGEAGIQLLRNWAGTLPDASI